MDVVQFREMKAFVRWSEADSRLLHAAGGALAEAIPEIVGIFDGRTAEHMHRAGLDFGPEQRARLRLGVTRWMHDLLEGGHDDAYYRRRAEIGLTHARLNLPPHIVFAAMAVVRQELGRRIAVLEGIDRGATLDALGRILDIELAIIFESYREALQKRAEAAEHREMAHRLREAEHLASIGRLAASLAHEIRNPLAGISGAIQVIGRAMNPEDPHRPVIDEILQQIDRLDETVQELLLYSRPRPPRLSRCDLGPAVLRVISLLREVPEVRRVSVRFHGPSDGPTVWLDESQFQQVITNALLNAAQACGPGGDVEIRVEAGNGTARVTVKDNGRGMSPEVARRAFEPFFTTKAKGTGLGLAICKKIVEAHRGTIRLESAPGRGTCLVVELPTEGPERSSAGAEWRESVRP